MIRTNKFISVSFNILELFCNAIFKASKPKCFGCAVVVMCRYHKNYIGYRTVLCTKQLHLFFAKQRPQNRVEVWLMAGESILASINMRDISHCYNDLEFNVHFTIFLALSKCNYG